MCRIQYARFSHFKIGAVIITCPIRTLYHKVRTSGTLKKGIYIGPVSDGSSASEYSSKSSTVMTGPYNGLCTQCGNVIQFGKCA